MVQAEIGLQIRPGRGLLWRIEAKPTLNVGP